MPLTEITIRNLDAPAKGQKTYRDDVVTGFGVRVSQGGSKSYVLTYGKARTVATIGRVGVIKLADARAEAKRILAEHTLGKNHPKATPFADALLKFLEDRYRGKRESTKAEVTRLLNRHFLPGFRPLTLKEISTDDISRKLARISAPSERLHAYRAIRAFMRWSVRQQFIASSPVDPIAAPSQDIIRERILTDEEVKAIWNACKGTFGTLVQLLYLTAQRKGQFSELEWAWVSDDAITWPAAAMKGDREHVLPQTPLQASILTATPRLHDKWVFPSQTLKTPFSGFSKLKAKLDRDSKVSNWRIHDLRRTAATKMAAHTDPHILQVLLAHSAGPISTLQAIYNKRQYLEEKRAALIRHEQSLEKLLQD